MPKFSYAIIATLIAALASPAVARADQVSTQILNPPHAPASIQRCQVQTPQYDWSGTGGWVNIKNLTKHELLTVSVQYSFYDADHAMFAQATMQYTPGEPLASADVQQFSGTFYPQHSEPFDATTYVTCRVMAATFTGEKSWRYGQRWREPLVSSEGGRASNTAAAPALATPPRLRIQVVSAWEDAAPRYESGIYVHDRIVIEGVDRTVAVHPHDFVLHVDGASGVTTVHGMSKWVSVIRC